jgi:type IV pilus assembly protein PilV
MMASAWPQRGFSLIEVLVTMVIIAIGLLGNAAMQALSLTDTASARNRALGAIEADALASMMHANVAYWQSAQVTTNTAITVTGTAGSANTTNFGTTIAGINTLVSAQGTDCVAGSCSNINMAAYDLSQWGLSLANLLPSGTGSITCQTTTPPSECQINVSWSENSVAVNSAVTGATTTQTYTLAVVP